MIYKPRTIVFMRIGKNIGLKLRLHLAKAADIWSAASCGVFVSLGFLSFAWEPEFGGGNDVLRAGLLAVFTLAAVCGIYARPRLMTKALFALSQIVTAFLCPPYLAPALAILLYPFAVLPLIFGARWRGARFAVLPLTLMVWLFMPDVDSLPPGKNIPEALYLPASLTVERPGGAMLVFGESSPDELLERVPYRSGWMHLPAPVIARGIGFKRGENAEIAIAIAGHSFCFDGAVCRKGIYRWLLANLTPDGVLVMPIDETPLLPVGDWRFSVLPGGDGKWVAARRGQAVCVDPDVLDARIRDFALPPDPPLLPEGAFSAMYPPAAPRAAVPPRDGGRLHWRYLVLFAALWMALRLLLCRRERMGTMAAALECSAALTLYSLALLPKWSAAMMDTGIPPFALFAGVGMLLLPRPLPVVRRGTRILAEAAIGVLPWVGFFHWSWGLPVSWFCWSFSAAAVFTGLRVENRRAALTGAFFGVAAGVLLHWALGAGDSALPVCVAVLLMIPSWLRR